MDTVKKHLPLRTGVALVVGTMIGSGIFIVSADMSRVLGSPFLMLLAWVISGIITVSGALSYGELAGMFPKQGGQYQYLKEIYNEVIAFLYGWAMFAVIQSGTIAAVAVGFAKFSGILMPHLISPDIIVADLVFFKISSQSLWAIFSLLVLTLINTRGLRVGAIVQNTLTIVKVLSFGILIVLGLLVYRNHEAVAVNFGNFFHDLSHPGNTWTFWGVASAIGVAMVGSLFSHDSWNNVTFIASEIENPRRNVARAMFFGTSAVTIIYLLANLSYLCLLPFWGSADGADVAARGIQHAAQDRVGVAATTAMLGQVGAVLMAALIMVSTFGCNNGIILASVRVYQSMAQDGLFFEKMKDSNRAGAPSFALWVQFIWCSVLCLSGKYGDLLDYVMFVVMLFYILTIAGIFILRRTRPDAERPYKAFGYPFLPALYVLLAGAFTLNLLYTKPQFTVPGLVILVLGLPVYLFWKSVRKPKV